MLYTQDFFAQVKDRIKRELVDNKVSGEILFGLGGVDRLGNLIVFVPGKKKTLGEARPGGVRQ